MDMDSVGPLVPIPQLGHQDVGIVESLLIAGDFEYHVHDGFGESPAVLFVRAADLAAVKEFLADYRVRNPRDEMIPIPW
jgi:hypothetical protein